MSCHCTQILAAAQNYLVMNPFWKQIENNKMLCFWILAHLAGGAFISEWNKLESNYCFNCELCLVMEFILSIYLIKIYLGGKNILCNCQLQQTKGTMRLWIGSCLQETTAPFLSSVHFLPIGSIISPFHTAVINQHLTEQYQINYWS